MSNEAIRDEGKYLSSTKDAPVFAEGFCPLTPFADWVVVKEAPVQKKTDGGIILAQGSDGKKKRSYFGTVFASGSDAGVAPGTVVYYHDFGRVELICDKVSWVALRRDDLIASL